MFFSVVQQDKISLLQTIQYFLPFGHKPFQVMLWLTSWWCTRTYGGSWEGAIYLANCINHKHREQSQHPPPCMTSILCLQRQLYIQVFLPRSCIRNSENQWILKNSWERKSYRKSLSWIYHQGLSYSLTRSLTWSIEDVSACTEQFVKTICCQPVITKEVRFRQIIFIKWKFFALSIDKANQLHHLFPALESFSFFFFLLSAQCTPRLRRMFLIIYLQAISILFYILFPLAHQYLE